MYISPNHPDPPRPASPPPEQGKRLAMFPRGRDDEMRVCLSEYQGRAFISLRVWSRGSDGQFWPDRAKGVGPDEQTRTGRLDARGPRDDRGERPQFVEKGRRQRPDWRERQLPDVPPGGAGAFDEFGGGESHG